MPGLHDKVTYWDDVAAVVLVHQSTFLISSTYTSICFLQVNDEVKRYNTVLKKFADAGDDEWEAIVAVHRGDLQKAFFEHLQVCPDR